MQAESQPDGTEHLPKARLPAAEVAEVRDTCLCLRSQQVARLLARRFDDLFRPYGLTNGQFSLLMALNQPEAPTVGRLARFLAMDRTTLTAALKPLERSGWATLRADASDRRARVADITPEGVALLARVLPLWRASHAALEVQIAPLPAGAVLDALAAAVTVSVARPA